MNTINWLADPRNGRFLKGVYCIALFLVFAADFFVHRHHAAFIWDAIPGFGAVYGFVCCVLMIIVFKFIGHEWLMKKEGYYD